MAVRNRNHHTSCMLTALCVAVLVYLSACFCLCVAVMEAVDGDRLAASATSGGDETATTQRLTTMMSLLSMLVLHHRYIPQQTVHLLTIVTIISMFYVEHRSCHTVWRHLAIWDLSTSTVYRYRTFHIISAWRHFLSPSSGDVETRHMQYVHVPPKCNHLKMF